MHHLSNQTAIRRIPVLCCLLFICAVAAQAQVTGYPGKFICGYEEGNVPLLNDPTPLVPAKPYENFKPGNYATTFNVLNLNPDPQEVRFIFATSNLPHARVATINILGYSSVDVGCEIANPFLSPTFFGQRFEGMLVPVTNNANFIVDAVYTFESQNAFERHLVYEDGGSNWTFGQTLDQILFDFTPPTVFFQAEAASGAGGLGLGASIDVERLDPVTIIPTMVEDAEEGFPMLSGDG